MNKCTMNEYLILLNLLMNKFNIYFNGIFYKEILQYLIPYLDIKIHMKKSIIYDSYYDYCKLDYFIAKYNIKYNLLRHYIDTYTYTLFSKTNVNENTLFSKTNVNENTYTYTYIHQTYYNDIKIIYIKIYFFMLYGKIYIFKFTIPYNIFNKLYNIKKYKDFNEEMNIIYENNHGCLMDDYIFSNVRKKIVYYELFKKLILRLFIKN